ncbi:rho family-interacting cell polarization regulator 1 [Neosynchiropus ocellatus]
MYSGYGGGPSRTLSTMSLSVRPVRRLASKSITRSQSFTGVNTSDKPYRHLSVFSTPGLSRRPSRASRMFTVSQRSNPLSKVPQPERLDEVYAALRRGLQSYLQVHQMDLDNLSRQMKESKRNSRLGFLYELDKQVKMIERYIRRLEFHLSKIEELYEAYCLQRRLRDGANKMVNAYTGSSVSKGARESLAEANKGYKEYTENMCVLENELENQLGEFHIKMKGLAGFARLCAGDQYEIFMKYGRQRWKLRGRIEMNGKQVWDSEDMMLLPLINDFLSIKVTELKSLANHVIVGSISCETKDLFSALPQTVAVDINDLGTIKLSLEVTWNPFDKDDQASVTSTVNKASTVNKRFSTLFNQSPPDTPSLREQAFYSLPRNLTRRQHWPLLDTFRDTLSRSCSCSDKSPTRPHTVNMLRRHEEMENGTAWSNSSESSDDSSSPQLSAGQHNSAHHKTVVIPTIQPVQPRRASLPVHRDSPSSSLFSSHSSVDIPADHQSDSQRCEDFSRIRVVMKVYLMVICSLSREEPDDEAADAGTVTPSDGSLSHTSNYSRSLSHISESSADGATDRPACEESVVSAVSVNDIEMEVPDRTPEPPAPAAGDAQPEREEENSLVESGDRPEETLSLASPGTHSAVESGDVTYLARRVSVEEDVSEVLVDSGLESALGSVVSSLDDYRGQFPELQLLEQELKLLQVTLKGGRHSRTPSLVSLTVETALCSFNFLNMSDGEDEEEGRTSRNGSSLQDRDWDSCSSPASPLTTGCADLDCTLLVHLMNCSAQLLRLGTFGPLRCGEMYALDNLLREVRVIEIVRRVIKDGPQRLLLPSEVIPELGLCMGAVSLWQQCVGTDGVYSASTEKFVVALTSVYGSALPEKASSMAEAVFTNLAERVLTQRLPKRDGNRSSVTLTLFQFWSYLEANGITNMKSHVTELAEEVWLVQTLMSCDQDRIIQALRRPPECSLQREGLHAVARLLKDPRGKVMASASSALRSVATQPRHREQALVHCLELLEDEHVLTRVCGCKALACLKAKESIDQLVYLCRTDKEEVRDAAKQALLTLGEEGKMAYRHVETSQEVIPSLFAPGSMASTAF